MKNAYYTKAVGFLARNGITDATSVAEIVGGFDLRKPIYEQVIEPDDCLYQFTRRTEAGQPDIKTGRWFCLAGATMDSLGIFSGGAGRSLSEFTVSRPVVGLEGTAASIRRNWQWAGGGTGGATQIFLPQKSLFALVGRGTHI